MLRRLADLLTELGVTQLDRSLTQALNRFAGNVPRDMFIGHLNDAPFFKGALFMTVIVYLWLRRDGDVAARRESLLLGLATALIASVVSRAMQVMLPLHPRPIHDPLLGFIVPAGVVPENLNAYSSFPSDTVVLFFALSLAIWRHSRVLGVAAAAWTLLFMGVLRVYTGYHYPSDVLGGVVVATALTLVLPRALAIVPWPGWVLRAEARRPTAFYLLAFLFSFEFSLIFEDVRRLAADGARLLAPPLASVAPSSPPVATAATSPVRSAPAR